MDQQETQTEVSPTREQWLALHHAFRSYCEARPWERLANEDVLVNLPGYSPDCNADEAIWGWVREEATGNLCLGSRTAVQARVGRFLDGLAGRRDEVRRRCRTVLQSRAEALMRDPMPDSQHPANAHPTLALV